MEVTNRFPVTTARESIFEKNWAAGDPRIAESEEYTISDTMVLASRRVLLSQVWYKMIDEAVVNAVDQVVKKNPVTRIEVAFRRDGTVSVSNDGNGVPVVWHQGANMYLPQFVFGETFAGDSRVKEPDAIIGGDNALGIKITNIFSLWFTLETHDRTSKKTYRQRWSDHMKVCEPCEIVPVCGSGTTVTFMPDYSKFGYDGLPANYEELCSVLRFRCAMAQAYCSYARQDSPIVRFNGETYKVRSMADVARMVDREAPAVTITINPSSHPVYHYPWEVTFLVSEVGMKLSNVNGIVVTEGTHFQHVLGKVTKSVREFVSQKLKGKVFRFQQSYIDDKVSIFMNCGIPSPGWTGQRKEKVSTNVGNFKGYDMDKKDVDKIAKRIKNDVLAIVQVKLQKVAEKQTKVANFDDILDAKKYRPATLVKSRPQDCSLILVEGDSAMTQVVIGITNNPHLGTERYGVLSLGGVIINVRTECNDSGKRSRKLINNKFMNAFMKVTGLNLNYKYDRESPGYQREIASLKYRHVIGCVDQDLDGKGKIWTLVLNMIAYFWPRLYDSDYVKRCETPIIRAYPVGGGKVSSFYYEHEFEEWKRRNDQGRYIFHYYKGLASHSAEEAKKMFDNFDEHLFTYYYDDDADSMFDTYMGKDSEKRKDVLSIPPKKIEIYDLQTIVRTKRIPCSYHLVHETDIFQRDDIERKIDHVADGNTQWRRKFMNAIIKKYRKKSSNKQIKVSQLSGYISETQAYHHSEEALCKGITITGFLGPGGRQLPPFIPASSFGSRLKGGKDAGKPRYIELKYNRKLMDLLYPDDDYYLLDFRFEGEDRIEPVYFVPILPMAILESVEVPSHGWKLKRWARDAIDTTDAILAMINFGDDIPVRPLRPYTGGWRGRIVRWGGDEYSVGTYQLQDRKLIITELPLRVWTDEYVEWLQGSEKMKAYCEEIENKSNDEVVKITIHLTDEGANLEAGDGGLDDEIVCTFRLKERMVSHVNLIGINGEVLTFSTYEEVIKAWYPVRKAAYSRRIDRLMRMAEMKISKYANMVKYLENYKTYKTAGKTTAAMNSTLQEHGFDKFDDGKLQNPKYIPPAQMKDIIVNSPAASYDYLLRLNEYDKSVEGIKKYKSLLEKEQASLRKATTERDGYRFPGANLWRQELEELREVIREGFMTKWKFGEHGKYQL